MITPSAPMPSVSRATCWISSSSAVLPSPTSMPSSRASWMRLSSRSTPMTRQPLARRSWTVSWPRMPRPMTTNVSPSVGDGATDALEGDGTKGHRARLREPELVRDGDRQVARDADDLGVVRGLRPGARDPIADVEVGHALADLDHDAGRRVAGRLASRELAFDHVPCCADAFCRGDIEDSLDLAGLRGSRASRAGCRSRGCRSARSRPRCTNGRRARGPCPARPSEPGRPRPRSARDGRGPASSPVQCGGDRLEQDLDVQPQ